MVRLRMGLRTIRLMINPTVERKISGARREMICGVANIAAPMSIIDIISGGTKIRYSVRPTHQASLVLLMYQSEEHRS